MISAGHPPISRASLDRETIRSPSGRSRLPQFLAACMLLIGGATGAAGADRALGALAERPNVLIVIADDATWHELPLYGGKNIRTPNLDRLAAQGLMFRRAYVSMAMCTPCRTELYTGLYPMHSGVCWNHAAAKPGTRSIVHHLGALGYRVGLAGKTHIQPRTVFPFEMVEGWERDCVALQANHDCQGIRAFMARDPSQPFCLVVALVVPHAPWTVGDSKRFDPAKLVLAPYMVDTPQTRVSLTQYFAEYELMDRQLGDILKTLDETGQAGRTLVLFTSEQGGQWPGCKWTNWEEGIHTALVARWPGRIAPCMQTDALVQYTDVLPTLLDAAGGSASAGEFDGSSFLPVLLGRANTHRKFAYAMHNNLPEGPAYPIRSVHNGRFHYLRNLSPQSLYIEKHVMGSIEHNPYWLSWMWKTEADAHALAMVTRYLHRPAEHLYDTQTDPLEMNDLAADPDHAAIKAELARELDRWMRQQRDPGAELDTARRRAEEQPPPKAPRAKPKKAAKPQAG